MSGMDFWMFDRMMDMSGAKGGNFDSGDTRHHSTSNQENYRKYPEYPYDGCVTCEKVSDCEDVKKWREQNIRNGCDKPKDNTEE